MNSLTSHSADFYYKPVRTAMEGELSQAIYPLLLAECSISFNV